jgi:hypothetical protein
MDRQTKTVKAKLIDAGDAGSFEAIIATFDEVDSDGDIVLHGAFDNVKVAPIMPAHFHGSVPLGKATIEERVDKAVAVGKFNLDVAPARDWHEAIKFDLEHPPPVQEWSWGYHAIESSEENRDGERIRLLAKLDITEISPVLRGASVGTMTLSAKSAPERHKTETSAEPWDAAPNVRRFNGEPYELFAWHDPIAKSGAFPHHFVDEGGKAGPASTRACLKHLAQLSEAPISSEDARTVHAHLAGHLRDAGYEVPDLRPGLKLVEQIRLATWDVDSVLKRVREVIEERAKQSRPSAGHVSDEAIASSIELATLFEEMHTTARNLEQLVKEQAPDDEISKAIAAWERHKARAALLETGGRL